MFSAKNNTTTKQQGLTRQQKESVFLLSLGTFLEYFDFLLYIHMAVLLNELFFPQTDPVTSKILGAFAFCSTFIFRPIGGFVIGLIGDKIGRKKTVMITTLMMSGCCITMALLPTYAEIGLTATIIMLICRILQGFSSMGEKVGAQLYITESFKQPHRYTFVAFVNVHAMMGGLFALMVSFLATSESFNWRIAFWVGTLIAVIGLVARTRLRETPEFVDYKRRLTIKHQVHNLKEFTHKFKETINIKAAFAYCIIRFAGSVAFYISYVYAGDFMKKSFGMTASEVINQNLKLSIISVFMMFLVSMLVRKNHPVKIAMIFSLVCFAALPFVPYLLNNVEGLLALLFIQFLTCLPSFAVDGVEAVSFMHLPVTRRFTVLAVTFAISAALSYVFVSFSLIPLTEYFGHYGILFVYIPSLLGLIWGINYLKNLEIKKGLYNSYPEAELPKSSQQKYNYNFKSPELYEGYNLNCKYSEILLNKLVGIKSIDHKLVEKAMVFCKKWHDGQFRKSGEEYYTHPFTVADMVVEYIPSTDVVIGALLHDLVEDTECTLELIKEEFNERVAQIVQRLTRVKTDPNGNKTKISVAELVENIRKAGDQEALLIKEIDRLHNLVTIESMSEEKQQHTTDETIEHIVPNAAYAVDGTNIDNKLNLEDNLLNKSK